MRILMLLLSLASLSTHAETLAGAKGSTSAKPASANFDGTYSMLHGLFLMKKGEPFDAFCSRVIGNMKGYLDKGDETASFSIKGTVIQHGDCKVTQTFREQQNHPPDNFPVTNFDAAWSQVGDSDSVLKKCWDEKGYQFAPPMSYLHAGTAEEVAHCKKTDNRDKKFPGYCHEFRENGTLFIKKCRGYLFMTHGTLDTFEPTFEVFRPEADI